MERTKAPRALCRPGPPVTTRSRSGQAVGPPRSPAWHVEFGGHAPPSRSDLPLSTLQVGVQKPAMPGFAVVQPAIVASFWSVRLVGSCGSQIQPLGHSVPPTLQNWAEQYPRFVLFETQSPHAVVDELLQPVPGADGVVTAFTQVPWSVWQCWVIGVVALEPEAEQSASVSQPPKQ